MTSILWLTACQEIVNDVKVINAKSCLALKITYSCIRPNPNIYVIVLKG